MANLSTSGSFPNDWCRKAYSGGMKFMNGDTILARITPCLENGKTAYINFLDEGEVAFGSTEYIVLASKGLLPAEFFYFLARNRAFVSYATNHMNGSSGRQRVSAQDIEAYRLRTPSSSQAARFADFVRPIMEEILTRSLENRRLSSLRGALLPKLLSGEIDVSKVEIPTPPNNHLSLRAIEMSDLNDLLVFEVPALLRKKAETRSISIHLIDCMLLNLKASRYPSNTTPELQRLVGKKRHFCKSLTHGGLSNLSISHFVHNQTEGFFS